MKIVKNEKLIKRNGTIGNWTSLGAMAILGGTMFVIFRYPANTQILIYTGIAFVVGLILTQVGSYMGIRFGRSPRPDEKLDAGLKGLQNEYVMYHYTTPVSHLLLGPAGVWVLMPYHQVGKVRFQNKRWRISGGGFLQAYMRVFGQEGLGRPDIEVESEVDSLKRYFTKHLEEAEIPEIEPLMVFTSDKIELDVDSAPVPALKLKQLKDFIRQKAKQNKFPAERLERLKALFE